jgi:uncharacterized protein (TIGR03083 family)
MKPVEPILTAHLFPELHTHLINLLRELTGEEWERPTVCAPWTIKDVAAHLLDTEIRRLSFHRDKQPLLPPERPITNNRELIDFLNRLNNEWVKAAWRIGPNLLIDFLDLTGRQLCDFFRSLDPYEPAFFSVGWAGEEMPANWFDIAREYTERWTHQQQIRDALGRPGLTTRRQLYPVLDTFMRALPYTYREVEAAAGTSLLFTITGEAGGDWSLLRENGSWQLFYGRPPQPAARVTLDQDIAWRLFTKGISPDQARRRAQIEGDERLGASILHMVSIMA